MGWSNRVSLRERLVKDVGSRIDELRELLGWETLQKFGHHCLIEPGSLRRLVQGGDKLPSFELLVRLCAKVPNLNVNWLVTGYGPPLVDWDAIHLSAQADEARGVIELLAKDVSYASEELSNLNERLQFNAKCLPSDWVKTTNEKINSKLATPKDPKLKHLGTRQRHIVKLLKGGAILVKQTEGFQFHVYKNDIPIEAMDRKIIPKLAERGLIIEFEPNKWKYNGKLFSS